MKRITCAGCSFLSSFLLFFFLVTVEKSFAEPLVVAHRGASKEAPENTLPAFALAWEQGADAIEGDFHLTRDGEIVCIHDTDTKKVSGIGKRVRECTLAELRRLDVGLWRGEKWKGTRIPTLAEVMGTVPAGKKIYVEIKCGVEIVPKMLEEIAESDLGRDQVVVIAFSAAVIAEVERRVPEMETYWLTSLKRAKSGEVSPGIGVVLETLTSTGTDGVSAGQNFVDQRFVGDVSDRGFGFHVWTVDDLETARRFESWGARSITTNVPGVIKSGLGAHSK